MRLILSLYGLCIYMIMKISGCLMIFFPDHCFSFLVSDIDYCINVTCKNGGSCVDGLDKYSCSCGAGFSGDHCETGTAEIRMILVESTKS